MMKRKQLNPYYEIMIKQIPKDYTVLDLGCGCGLPFIGTDFPLLIGVDTFKKKFYMPEYNTVLYSSIEKINDLVQEKSFDTVAAIDVIEHLDKQDGYKLLTNMETIANKMVMVFTPLIWSKNDDNINKPGHWTYGNKHNLHKSLWNEQDFVKLGYEIVKCQENYVLAIKHINMR